MPENGEVLPAPDDMRVDLAHRLQEEILDDYHLSRMIWVRLAANLYRMLTGGHYADLGYETFEGWVAEQPFKRTWAYELAKVYRAFVIDRGVEPSRLAKIDQSKVPIIEPAVRRGKISVDEALADAESLPQRELVTRYKELASPNGAGPDTSTRYDAAAEPVWVKCYVCGSRVTEDRVQPPVDAEHLFARTV